jgi:formate hydrogenlyase subunit 4
MLVLAMLVGLVESVMARMRLNKVPQLLIAAAALAVFALLLAVR